MTVEDVRNCMKTILWVAIGDSGQIMCNDCRYAYGSPDCFGCPVAWRKINGKTEYYKEPIHGLPEEM